MRKRSCCVGARLYSRDLLFLRVLSKRFASSRAGSGIVSRPRRMCSAHSKKRVDGPKRYLAMRMMRLRLDRATFSAAPVPRSHTALAARARTAEHRLRQLFQSAACAKEGASRARGF